MSDELNELGFSPAQAEEVREIMLALHPFLSATNEAGDVENLHSSLPPELRVKFERLTEILEGSRIGPLLKLVRDDPEP